VVGNQVPLAISSIFHLTIHETGGTLILAILDVPVSLPTMLLDGLWQG
jgi:hypothetical protein